MHANGRRPSPFISYVDPAMVTLLTAPTLAAQLYGAMNTTPIWNTPEGAEQVRGAMVAGLSQFLPERYAKAALGT